MNADYIPDVQDSRVVSVTAIFRSYSDISQGVSSRVDYFVRKMLDWYRGGSRTAETSKMELFVIVVNSLQSLTIITKRSILDVAAVLDPNLWQNR